MKRSFTDKVNNELNKGTTLAPLDNQGLIEDENKDGSLKEEKAKKKFIYFENIECNLAMFILSKENKLRRLCYKIVKSSYFEPTILAAIIFSYEV
jgi:hypothetical protein